MKPKRKLLFIGNIPAPYIVHWLNALQEFYEVRALFYESASGKRDTFWDLKPAPFWQIIDGVGGKKNGRYYTTRHLSIIRQWRPDLVVLGGFPIPGNWMAYRVANKLGAKVCVMSETFRDAQDRPTMPSWKRRLITFPYRKLDAVLGLTTEAFEQFNAWPEFRGRVYQARYPCDLDAYLNHPLDRQLQPPNLLFANRLTEGYNPLGALQIFAAVKVQHPEACLRMNASGPLRAACERFIANHHLENSVTFLDHLRHWSDLNKVYREADILLFPARHSAGNFTIYESMASGLGIIISEEIQFNGSLIHHGKNGCKVPLAQIDTMIAWACRYIEDPGLLQQHAVCNRALVAELGITGTARFYHSLFQKLFPDLT